MKKFLIMCLTILLTASAFSLEIAVSADSAEKITLQEYPYNILSGWNGYGEVYCPQISCNDNVYLKVQNSSEYTALMDTKTGELVTPYVYWINSFGEYSDLIVLKNEDSTGVLYDLEKRKEICKVIDKNGLVYGGHFSPNGGFIYLAEDNKLHFVSNDGVIGNAVNLNHEDYQDEYDYLMTWAYLGEGLFQLGVGNEYMGVSQIGLVNESGDVIIEDFGYVNTFHNGLAITQTGGLSSTKHGLIDKYGNYVLEQVYDKIQYNSERAEYFVKKGENYYIANASGVITDTLISDTTLYDGVYNFLGNGIAVVNEVGEFYRYKYGVIAKDKSFIVPIEYTMISTGGFNEGVCSIRLYGSDYEVQSSIVIDTEGEIVISSDTYKSIGDFSEGLAACENNNGRYGYIDKTGNAVIPFQYQDAQQFSEGLAACGNEDGKYGYINNAGEVIIPFEYNSASDFENGTAQVLTESNGYVTIDKNGNVISKEQSKYSLTELVEEGKDFKGSIQINATGERVDISHLNLLPVILGEKGDIIVGFTSDFSKAYRIIIAESEAAPVEITNFTASISGGYANVKLSVLNKTEAMSVYVASYNSDKVLEYVQTVNLNNNSSELDIPIKAGNKKYFKLFVWDCSLAKPACKNADYTAVVQ